MEVIEIILRINNHQKFSTITDLEIESNFHLKCEPILRDYFFGKNTPP